MRKEDSSCLQCALDYTYILGNTCLSELWRTVEGSGNLQHYFRTINIGVEREILLRDHTGTFCSLWGSELPEQLRRVNTIVFSCAMESGSYKTVQVLKPALSTSSSKTPVYPAIATGNSLEIASVNSAAIAGSSASAIPLMPLMYAEDACRINQKLDEEPSGPRARMPTSMESLQACRVFAHDKGNFEEVEQIKRSISWKLSVKLAARRRDKARKRDLREYIKRKTKKDWCKPSSPSDDDGPPSHSATAH